MKKNIHFKCLLASLFSFAISFAYAQGQSANTLSGIWELVSFSASHDGKPIVLTEKQLKIFDDAGTFRVIKISNIGTCQTVQGTYTITNDKTFVEKITTSVYEGISGKTNNINYTVKNNVLTAEGIDVKFKESWRKLPMCEN